MVHQLSPHVGLGNRMGMMSSGLNEAETIAGDADEEADCPRNMSTRFEIPSNNWALKESNDGTLQLASKTANGGGGATPSATAMYATSLVCQNNATTL